MIQFNQLDVATMPLQGKHLIEASAGTGKTYNITRLYLRMLLERRLSVQQILVMTFTRDATEELRGRIDASLRHTLANWHTLVQQDDYFIALAKRLDAGEAKAILHRALLFLDEASIFTIHGFCHRVLSEYAFETGVSFNAEMESDCRDLLLQCTQDWYRTMMHGERAEQFQLLAQYWSTPEKFIAQFARAMSQNVALTTRDADDIGQEFLQLAQQARACLSAHQPQLFAWLVDGRKDQQQRSDEFAQLLAWFDAVCSDIGQSSQPMPNKFLHGNRYGRAAFKQALLALIAPVLECKSASANVLERMQKAQAFMLARQGIEDIRRNLVEQKQQQNLLSFDDLIATLADSLRRDAGGPFARQLFEQFPAALIDEFQDTDPEQYAILTAIYGQQADAALYLIGDPKQAIYGFRGGDVFAYLDARRDCTQHWRMDTNWRSSVAMIEGYNRLFYGHELTQEAAEPGAVFRYGIEYFPVKASPKALAAQQEQGDVGFNDDYRALQFIHFPAGEPQAGDAAKAVKQEFRSVMAGWCAEEIQRLLQQPGVAAKDIAILVRDGTEANDIKTALEQRQLAAVYLSNRANLFHSTQCQHLLAVLKGILYVEDERLFCAALASELLNYRAAALHALQQDALAWQELKFAFVALRKQWLQSGFITMALTMLHEHGRLSAQDKDRALTNYIHLFELLQAASQTHRQPQALLFWFEQQTQSETAAAETELRLESDDELIKIVTQHGCKGLEYPIVFIPFSSRHKDPLKVGLKWQELLSYHDDQGRAQLSLDGSAQAKQRMADENYAESVRLLYVAITRAQQRCYVLTAAFEQAQMSPLGQTLGCSSSEQLYPQLEILAQQHPGAIGLQQVSADISVATTAVVAAEQDTAVVATFTGKIERDWWLSSFSALAKNIRHGGVSAPDRDADGLITVLEGNSYLARFALAKGAHSGNLLHDILEHSDFCAPDWAAICHGPLYRYGELGDGIEQAALHHWLQDIVDTPLEPALTLSTLSINRTLREVEFYFPMALDNVASLARLLTTHRGQGRATPMYPVQLPHYRKLLGMMHGFIDLIFEHQGKYYLADYKSSHLGDEFAAYKPELLRRNIERNYYDLQYLIYALALHRYLAARLENYQPELHFGGVYYLYLRGMTAQPEHQGAGVYYRAIGSEELTTLDALFGGVPSEHHKGERQHD